MCGTRIAENTGHKKIAKNSPSGHQRTTLSGCVFAIEAYQHLQELLNFKQQYLLHMSPQYGELRPTNGWDRLASLGHPTEFHPVSRLAFVTEATLLTGGQPNFSRCLSVSWAGKLYTLSGAFAPWRNFATCKIHFTFQSCVLLYWQHYCTTLQQRPSSKLYGVVQGMKLRKFRWRRHPYSAVRPSPWASAHILVTIKSLIKIIMFNYRNPVLGLFNQSLLISLPLICLVNHER